MPNLPDRFTTKSWTLLQLLPGKRGSTVSCHLQQSSVASTKKYYCLSYRWGDADESAPLIDINGKYFRVQQNLWNFLDVARSKYTWQWFWIDAICIDQQHIEEKSHQVRLMSKIYTKASKVVIWLGKGSAADNQKIREGVDNGGGRTRERSEMTADAVLTRPFWQSFVAMCENEYWKRAWIVQEITLAWYRVILLDNNELEWSKFANLVCFFDAENSHPSRSLQLYITKLKDSPAHTIIQITGRETTSKWNPRPLRDLLQDQMDRLCFCPRDGIYSLLSLCNEKDHLVPDYGINHIELLFRTVVACNRALGLIDLVCQLIRILAINKASFLNLPSTRLAIEFKIFAWSPLETVELDTQGENSKA